MFLAPPAAQPKQIAPSPIEKTYATWIAEHEPTPEELEKQRSESSEWDRRPKFLY